MKLYTGGTIVNAGSLYLSGGGNGFNNSTLQGTLTINRGAICLLNSPYALGQGGGGLTDVYLDGGTLTGANCDTFSISYHFDGGTLALSGNAILGSSPVTVTPMWWSLRFPMPSRQSWQ